MKCDECQKQGLASRINVDAGAVSTAMPSHYFYDEEGQYHAHDPNICTTVYRCSNGREWTRSWREQCWCESGDENQSTRFIET